MAAKKGSKAKSSKPEVAARGVILIEEILQTFGDKVPAPLAPEVTEAMRLGNGEPLPESLRRFLAVHGPGSQFPGDWSPGGRALVPVAFEALLRSHYDPEFLAYFDLSKLFESLSGHCHPLDTDTPLSFVYVGTKDEWGEYPVLTIQDFDDCLEVVIDCPGLDVYLACQSGVVPAPKYYGGIVEHPTYGPMLAATVKRNFGKQVKRRAKQYVIPAALANDGG